VFPATTLQVHLAATADVDQPREVAGFRANRHDKRVSEQNNSYQ
jgi:hypothetical protein